MNAERERLKDFGDGGLKIERLGKLWSSNG